MKLYDEVIEQILSLLQGDTPMRLTVEPPDCWPDAGKNNLVLRGDMAFELGGGDLPAVGCTAVTADRNLVGEDEILLYGRPLADLSRDVPYARIALVRVGEDSLGEGAALYNAIKRIEYTRYHVNPKGFMMRVSAIQKRESVRVGSKALEQGLDFARAGSLMLASLHENPNIQAARLIFINREDFPYEKLKEARDKADRITEALDHMMKNVIMDCGACHLQEVCDEVEGLRELHFQR